MLRWIISFAASAVSPNEPTPRSTRPRSRPGSAPPRSSTHEVGDRRPGPREGNGRVRGDGATCPTPGSGLR
jgi:hypothetical protein